MRVDKFLNATNILKRRNIAKDMIDSGLVKINGDISKASKNVRIGDIIEIQFLEHNELYRVLMIPQTKTIPKNKKQEYVQIITKE